MRTATVDEITALMATEDVVGIVFTKHDGDWYAIVDLQADKQVDDLTEDELLNSFVVFVMTPDMDDIEGDGRFSERQLCKMIQGMVDVVNDGLVNHKPG